MSLGDVLKGLLDEAGVPYKQNAKSFILACPRCRKADKLYVRRGDGRFVCWVCRDSEGFEGAAEWAFTELVGLRVPELRKLFYGENTNALPAFLSVTINDFFEEDETVPLDVPETLPEVMPDPGFRDLLVDAGAPGWLYLQKRGIPMEICRKYGFMYWPARRSVVFPVSARGKLLGWQTRYIGPTEYIDEETGVEVKISKAMTSFGLKKDRTFMFGDNLLGSDHAVLCEGPIDALKADLCGGNVATLGKAVSRTQLQLLRNSGIRRLYLALDPDAYIESRRVLKELVNDIEVYDMRPPPGYEDIGAMPMEEVVTLMKSAPRLDGNHLFIHLENPYV